MGVISLADFKNDNRCNDRRSRSEVVHLPVAPHVAARTRFSSLVPQKVRFLMPHEALSLLERAVEAHGEIITMAAITGPGDPLAVPDTTIKTVELVRKRYPDLKIGLKTLGVGGERFAVDLARAGVDYVELEVNGVQPEIVEKLYAWIRPGLKTLKIAEAAQLLIREQRNTVPAFKYNDIAVAIVTTLYPDYNVNHVKKISSCMMELGADGIALLPYEPESGAEVSLVPPDEKMVAKARQVASGYLPIVASLLSFDSQEENSGNDKPENTESLPKPTLDRPNVAVVSSNGMEVNLHLGEADKVLIYGPREDGLPCLLEARETSSPGMGKLRWQLLADSLKDCFVLLTLQAGNSPRSVLSENGVIVLSTNECVDIESYVDVLYGGGKKGKKKKKGK